MINVMVNDTNASNACHWLKENEYDDSIVKMNFMGFSQNQSIYLFSFKECAKDIATMFTLKFS